MEFLVKSLARRARAGDRDAACRLLGMYYADVFAYLRRLCGNRQDAEDLTQQTFLKVWASLNGFAGNSKFSTWVYSIAHNNFIDRHRTNNGKMRFESAQWWQECADDSQSPFAIAAERQAAQRLYQAVDRLDDDKRYIVHLHYYQGLSLKETAKVLGIATSTVKYRLREVLKILRVKMSTEQNESSQMRTIPIAKGETI